MPKNSTHDTINRRRRDRPLSTGKRVTPQPRDLLWFQKLHEHGPLSSTFLHEFSKHLAKNEKRSRDRMTDLFNESHTPHNGTYLMRPWQQFQTFDARYQDLVYDLAPAAERALKQNYSWHETGAGPSGPWQHRYMVAAITASIELATLNDPNLTYIPQHAILARANTTLRFSVPFKNPKTGKVLQSDLIPDAVFGLEYHHGGKSSFRFFVVEADRATEPSRASKFNRKSHLRNFLQYREYVGRGLYKEHLKLTAGMLVLNVTTSEATMSNMLKLAGEVSPGGNSYQLFQTCPQFGKYFKPAKPLDRLLAESWLRVGNADIRFQTP
jgi:Replication-relaxation